MSAHLTEAGFEDGHCGITYVGSRMFNSVSYAGAFSAKAGEFGVMAFGFFREDGGTDYGCQ